MNKIKFKQIAFPSNNKAFIKGDGSLDLNNYLILDENDKIPEEYIPDSVILKAIYYADFINSDYTPKLGETIIIIDYLKVDNKSVPSFVIGDGITTLKDLSPSGDFTKYSERAKVADDLGGREETREEQFTYQATANDESVKDGLAIVKSIKGNTVVANQLFKENLYNPLSIDFSYHNSIFTVNGTVPSTGTVYLDKDYTEYKQGDKILFKYPHNKPNPYGSFIAFRSTQNVFIRFPNDVNTYIIEIPTTDDYCPAFICISNKPYEDIQFSLQIINLTQMFGAGNEPTSVEEFERLYPILPKEYNEGSLLNLNADSIKSVGFNQWDEEWELGKMNHNGNTNTTYKNSICSKNYIKVLPDTDYFFNANGYVGYYTCFDKNYKNIYPDTAYLNPMNGLKHIPTNCHYIKFFINETTIYKNDICINLSHSGYRNGEYESYKESIANLPIKKYFPDGMKSAGEVRDEIVWDEGLKKYKAIKRVGSVDLGTLGWKNSTIWDSPNSIFAVYFSVKVTKNAITPNYIIATDYNIDKSLIIVTGRIYIVDSSYTDATSFKQSLQGQILYYELETPIETIIDDYDLIDYEVSDFGTEEIIADESTTPIIADIQYGFNAVDEIRNHRLEINKLKKGKINDGSVDSTSYYSKPSTGIPKTDLASAVQVSLDKADTAYNWGNHTNVGYAKQSEVTEEINHAYNTLFDKIPTELPPIDNSVTTAKIVDASISTNKIQDKAIIGSKIGYQEILTDHIANRSITNAKLAKSGIAINGTPIALGGIGQILGLVIANGSRCFLEISNNELILSAPTFAENGSIATIEEIVRYPLLSELPTIPNPTTNATEITDVNNWFDSNISNYIIPENLMYDFLSGKNSMSQMLLQLNNASCTLTSYNLDFKQEGLDINDLISNLIKKGSYEVYVENDIDSITTSGICTLKFKIDDHQVIIECYRKFN